jgi:hypothetical protein
MKQQDQIKFKKRVRISNVILLTLVGLSVGLIGLAAATVNVKFRNKDYQYSTSDKLKYERVPVKEAKVISLSNVSNCRIIASDSLRLEVAREYASSLRVVSFGDTLHVRIPKCCPEKKEVSELILYLPSGAVVVSDSSNIDLRGGYDFQKRPSYSFVLKRSHLVSTALSFHTFFDSLFVEGSGNSSLAIAEGVHVVKLDLSNVYDATLKDGFQVQALKTSFTTRADVTVAKENALVTIGASK